MQTNIRWVSKKLLYLPNSQPYPAPKKMIRCQPERRSPPGHVTVPPSEEWKAPRKGQTSHRCPNHEEVGALEGKDCLLLPGWGQGTPLPGGWREQRRRRILLVTVQIFQKWTWRCRKAASHIICYGVQTAGALMDSVGRHNDYSNQKL